MHGPSFARHNERKLHKPARTLSWAGIAMTDLAERASLGVRELQPTIGRGLSVILSKQYDAADTNWAYGIVGTIIGYWLKGK